MNKEKLELIVKSNKFGLEGKKIIGWIPPKYAFDNPDGTFILGIEDKIKGTSDR